MISSSFLSQRQAQELKTALIQTDPVEAEHTSHAESPDLTIVAEGPGLHYITLLTLQVAFSASHYKRMMLGLVNGMPMRG